VRKYRLPWPEVFPRIRFILSSRFLPPRPPPSHRSCFACGRCHARRNIFALCIAEISAARASPALYRAVTLAFVLEHAPLVID
jgi:hypothetical protein